MKTLFTSLIFFLVVDQVFATNYYLSNTGDDTNSGTSAGYPWISMNRLSEVISQLGPGDSILFKRGDAFYGSLLLASVMGSEEAPVVIGAYGTGDRPVIRNNKKISNWELYGNNIWVASVEDSISMVMINNVVATLGRYPNSNYLKISGVISRTEFMDNSLTQPDGYWKNASAVIRVNRFVIDNILIKDQINKRITLAKETKYLISDGYGYFIQNHLNTVDAFDEWYFDPSNNKLYVYMPDNMNINDQLIEGSTLDRGISLVNCGHIKIENMQVVGSADCAVYIANCTSVSAVNSRLSYSNKDGVTVRVCTNIELSNCEIIKPGGTGIIWHEIKQGLITKNKILGCGLIPGKVEGYSYIGINLSYGENNRIVENTIDSTGYCGINFSVTNNLTIERNFINHSCLTIDDGGGIYTAGGDKDFQDLRITHNIILNSIGNIQGTDWLQPFPNLNAVGIYLDHNSNNIRVDNNTVANCGMGISMYNPHKISIDSNTIFNNYYQFHIRNSNADYIMNNCTISHNTFVSTAISTSRYCVFIKYIRNIFNPALENTFDGNYYINPFNNEIITLADISVDPHIFTRYDFTATDVFTFDKGARSTPFSFSFSGAISEEEFIRLKYNATETTNNESIQGNYHSKDNEEITVLTLKPYSSEVMFLDNRMDLPMESKPKGDSVICSDSKSSLFTSSMGINASGEWKIVPSNAGVFSSGSPEATLMLNPFYTGKAKISFTYFDQSIAKRTPYKYILIKSAPSNTPKPTGQLELIQNEYRGIFSVADNEYGNRFQWYFEPSGIVNIISDSGDKIIISVDPAQFNILNVSVQKQNECGNAEVSEKLILINKEHNIDSLIKENSNNLDLLLKSDLFYDYPEARLTLYSLDGRRIIDCLVKDYPFYINNNLLIKNRMYLFLIRYGSTLISDKYYYNGT